MMRNLLLIGLATVLMGACGKSDTGAATKSPAEAQASAAESMLEHGVKATKSFYAKTQKLPRSVQELVASRALHIQKSADPWGQEMILEPLEGKAAGVRLCSGGADMAPGTDDDICREVTF